jgi:hypothetical protein
METPQFDGMLRTITEQCQREDDALLIPEDKARMLEIYARGGQGRDFSCYEFIHETLGYLQEQYTANGYPEGEFHRLYPRAGDLSDACHERIREIRDSESVAQLAEMQRLLEAHQRHLMACQRLLDDR